MRERRRTPCSRMRSSVAVTSTSSLSFSCEAEVVDAGLAACPAGLRASGVALFDLHALRKSSAPRIVEPEMKSRRDAVSMTTT